MKKSAAKKRAHILKPYVLVLQDRGIQNRAVVPE
jgi:hypothetical protein